MATAASNPVFDFSSQFKALTGNMPFPWQEKLFALFTTGIIPPNINLPTGSGKTSIMAIWLLALARQAAENPKTVILPRRLVWVVNRRVVVDQATDEAVQIRGRLTDIAGLAELAPVRDALRNLSLNRKDTDAIAISTLRGEKEDNREWSDDPSRPAIIIGTVDMIGSRLLFSGYGDGRYWRAQHAGLIGHDTLIVNDEAHLTPAFAALLSAIESRQKTGIKAFRTIRLSATHSSSDCWPDDLDDDRQNRQFKVVFEAQKSVQIRDAGKQFSTLLDLAAEAGPLRTLVFVDQPEKVKEIAEKLKKRIGDGAADRILTLTGTMRGLERDQMVESPVFKAFAGRQRPSESYWLIATSAGEVGINISSDRLITELGALDHLLQRFGRLNRFGETEGEAFVLVSNADEKELQKAKTLDFLRSLPMTGENTYDISPAALFGRELPADACTEPPLIAPIHDWLIDVWSQTSLGSHPARPAVEPWLHGSEPDYAHTYIAWREDTRVLTRDDIDDEDRNAALQKYRVLAHERVQEPTFSLIKNLKILAERAGPETRILCQSQDGATTALKLGDVATEKAYRTLAYSQLILPPGCGTLKDGMFWPEVVENDGSELLNSDAVSGSEAPLDASGCKWERLQGAVVSNPERASYIAYRGEDGAWTAIRLGILEPERETLSNLDLATLHRFASIKGWRLLLRVLPENDGGEVSSALLYFGKASVRNNSGVVILSVDQHVMDVAKLAKLLAERAGLPAEISSALETAGRLHDLGKKQPIWQRASGGPVQVNGECVPVAKPVKVMRGKSLGGFRHELASLRYAEPDLTQLNISSEIRDLTLHLIAAHHGHARPCFQKKAYDREHLKNSERLALVSAQRFARLQDTYGAWGLAYLESILKAADAIASDASAAEEQTDDE